MNEQISILIIDDNIDFCNVLNEYLNQIEGFVVKGIAKDGMDGILKVKGLKPDVIILDLIMPNLDGIGVLERMSKMQFTTKPIVIVLSAISKDIIVQKVMELGAEYYILKPFDIDLLVSRIKQLYRERENSVDMRSIIVNNSTEQEDQKNERDKSKLEHVIANLIKEMGITPNIAGYRYLREIVTLMVEGGVNNKYHLKNAYKEIANMHKITQGNVERAIKCAIDSAIKKSQGKTAGNTHNLVNGGLRLSSSQVINLLIDKTNSIMIEE